MSQCDIIIRANTCYSKLNFGSKFHAEVAIHLPHIKLRKLYIP